MVKNSKDKERQEKRFFILNADALIDATQAGTDWTIIDELKEGGTNGMVSGQTIGHTNKWRRE